MDQIPTPEPLHLSRSEGSATPLAPAAIISSPRSAHSGETAGQSQLSSPFMEKLSIASRSQRSVSPPAFSLDPDDVFTARPMRGESSARAESERLQALRMEYLRGEATQDSEAVLEARRPPYLKRMERASSSDILQLGEQSGAPHAGLGIADSPNKGRRIQLFQETSEESFEESLMAGGYPKYGSGPGYDVLRTPGKDRSSPLSEHTLAWLQHSTPDQPGPSRIPETPADEREAKKRKRLAAFQTYESLTNLRRKLMPVYLEGKGRVLLDVSPEDGLADDDTPRKRKKNRRRQATGAHPTESPGGKRSTRAAPAPIVGPNWPDLQFPWSVRLRERVLANQAEEEERLRRIAEFLERDSGDEESGSDEEPSAWGQVEDGPPKRARMGRGKMVPLHANPGGGRLVKGSVYLPSGPADARAALLSKKAARRLRYRLDHPETEAAREEDDDDSTISCVCHGRNDGEEAVQCDRCDRWYHLSCVGLQSVDDLGSADAAWYCPKCERTPSPELIPSSEPTLVPSEERAAPRTPRDPLFYDASVQESPLAEAFSFRVPPSSAWGSSPGKDPATPFSRATRNMFATPNFLSSSPLKEREREVFDPAVTPSRGDGRYALFQTPGRGFGLGGRALTFSGGDAWGTPVRASVLAAQDESPVRRSSGGRGELER